VDAYVNAIPFYQKNDFDALDNADINKHTRLFFYDLVNAAPRPF
jgi:hypothetical protein